MAPEQYERLTYGIALAAGETLARLNPQMCVTYVSGAGTDSTEQGSRGWARVKGRTENALLRLPFKAVMFRPNVIQSMHGEVSKTPAYRMLYALSQPVFPLLRRLFPAQFTTTEELGRAMIAVARGKSPLRIVESRDIGRLANAQASSSSMAALPPRGGAGP